MSKHKTKEGPCRSTIAIPLEMKNEFRKLCVVQDLKPSDIAKGIIREWIEKEKKKKPKLQVGARA